MRRRVWGAALLLVAAGCVTKVVGVSASFPGRAEWQGCVRERLEGLGYRVSPADSAAAELRARRGVVQVLVARDRAPAASPDTAPTPLLHLTVSGGEDRAVIDTLVVYCSRVSAGVPD